MSTTARKARKRAHLASIAAGIEHGRFEHPVKVGTPVPNRIENQPHLHGIGRGKTSTRATAAARRRIAEYDSRTADATRGLPWPDHRRASRAA